MKQKVVFFGSGPVAAESLRLLAQDFEIEAVITKPRPAHHKGSVPVLELAESLRLSAQTVSSKLELDTLIDTKPFTSELAVLIDFGIIVSQKTIDYFPYGIINSHFSLLPEWRGADPITFAILNGQEQTGVSLMLLVEAMDEGPLLSQGIYDITPDETTPSLTKQLIKLSHALLVDAVQKYISGEISPRPQEVVAELMNFSIEPTYSRKLNKEDGIIDWQKPAEDIEREVRAYNEWPKSLAKLGNIDVVITKAHAGPSDGVPGKLEVLEDKKVLIVYCGKGYLCIDELKPAGKKEMPVAAFLAGYKDRLTTD